MHACKHAYIHTHMCICIYTHDKLKTTEYVFQNKAHALLNPAALQDFVLALRRFS